MGGSPLLRIVRVLGGEVYAGGRRASVPGPGHSRADRSVSLLLDGERVVVHSFGASDWRTVLDDLRARGLVDADGRMGGGGPPRAATPSPSARIARALELWSQGRAIEGTLSAQHLARRAIDRSVSAALRHHPALPLRAYAGQGGDRPALLALICDADGRPCGVEATYLAPNGLRARLSTPRKTLGVRPVGSAVRLYDAAPEMLVGEGVFTALSASHVFGLPAWALMAAQNLAAWAPPSGVRRVLVAADRGPVGEQAAARLRARLAGMGVRAEWRAPPPPFGDWNDWEASERKRREGGKGRG